MRLKAVGLGLFLILVGAIFWPRYLAPTAGVNTLFADYASHSNIQQHIKRAWIFPTHAPEAQDVNSVSQYLPIYHGLWVFPGAALALEGLGLPRPGAYALIMDVALLLLFVFFISVGRSRSRSWIETALALLVALMVVIPAYFRSVELSFFPQVLAYSLLCAACLSEGARLRPDLDPFQKRLLRIATTVLLGLALFSYPDFILWLLPVVAFRLRRRCFFIPALIMMAVWGLFTLVMLKRIHLSGPESHSLFAFLALGSGVALFWKELRRKEPLFFAAAVSLVAMTTLFVVAGYQNGSIGYYTHKLIYPCGFFLLYLVLRQPLLNSSRGRIFAALLIYASVYFESSPGDLYARMAAGPKAFNNQMYDGMAESQQIVNQLELAESCRPAGTLYFPTRDEAEREYVDLRLGFRAGLAPSYEITTFNFRDPVLHAFFQSPDHSESFQNFLKAFRIGFDQAYATFFDRLNERTKSETPTQDFCVVVPIEELIRFESDRRFQPLGKSATEVFFRFHP